MKDTSIKEILVSCFTVGYWLGKANAKEEARSVYSRQKDLTIESCKERLMRLLKLDERENDGKTT